MLLWSSAVVILMCLFVVGGFPEDRGWVASFAVFLAILEPLHRAFGSLWKLVGGAFDKDRK